MYRVMVSRTDDGQFEMRRMWQGKCLLLERSATIPEYLREKYDTLMAGGRLVFMPKIGVKYSNEEFDIFVYDEEEP